MSEEKPAEPKVPAPVEPVTRKTLIATALDTRPDAGRVLREAFGLPCEECPVAESETVEEGAGYYGLDADEMVRRLNACAPEPRSLSD